MLYGGNHAMEPSVITIPTFNLIGFSLKANLTEIAEQQLGKRMHDMLLSRSTDVQGKLDSGSFLLQLYPMKPNFNPEVDRFTQLFGYKVAEMHPVPPEMTTHAVPDNRYVSMTHRGPESTIGQTYDYLYGQWIPKHGYQPIGYDFEYWGERYAPEQSDNEIDIYIAIR